MAVAHQGVGYLLVQTRFPTGTAKAVPETVEDLAFVGDHQFVAQIAHKDLGEAGGILAVGIGFKGREQAPVASIPHPVDVTKETGLNDDRVQGQTAPGGRVLEAFSSRVHLIVGVVVDDQAGDPVNALDIGNTQLGDFLLAATLIERQQGQPDSGIGGFTTQTLALGVNRRAEDAFEVVQVEGFAGAAVVAGDRHPLGGIAVQLAVVDSHVEQGAQQGHALFHRFGAEAFLDALVPVSDDLGAFNALHGLVAHRLLKLFHDPLHVGQSACRSAGVEGFPVLIGRLKAEAVVSGISPQVRIVMARGCPDHLTGVPLALLLGRFGDGLEKPVQEPSIGFGVFSDAQMIEIQKFVEDAFDLVQPAPPQRLLESAGGALTGRPLFVVLRGTHPLNADLLVPGQRLLAPEGADGLNE